MPPLNYSPTIDALVSIAHPVSLGPGTPNSAAGDRLRRLAATGLFPPEIVSERAMADACLAGLWLRFDYLDESHSISQGIHAPEGSFWHAIMHRREPDASNSKYWWRRVGQHAVLAELERESVALGYDYTSPAAFVDFCERVRDTGTPEEGMAKRVQELEWRLLFDYCLRAAVG